MTRTENFIVPGVVPEGFVTVATHRPPRKRDGSYLVHLRREGVPTARAICFAYGMTAYRATKFDRLCHRCLDLARRNESAQGPSRWRGKPSEGE
jgi:hypothetical protein